MRRIALLSALLGLAALLVAPTAPALAEKGVRHDPRDDTVSDIDYRKLEINNGRRTIHIRATFRDLTPDSLGEYHFYMQARSRYGIIVRTWRKRDGTIGVSHMRIENDGAYPHKCKRAKVHRSPRKDQITVTYPWSCVPKKSGTKFMFDANGYVRGEPSDLTRPIWVKRG